MTSRAVAPRVAAPDEPDADYVTLPISVLASGERRLEAETYLTGGYGLRIQIQSALAHRRLTDLAEIWQPSRLKGTQVAESDGIPFFTATQVFDIRPSTRKWLAPSKTPDLSRRTVERGWILVTCSGSVGDAIMSYGPHLESVISHDLLRVQVRDPKHAGYVYAFLRSRHGRTMMRSSRYGSVVKHLEPEHLFDVPVPDATDNQYEVIGHHIRNVFALRDHAHQLTLEAETIYATAVFPPQAVDAEAYSVMASKMFSGRRRLDASHYNPIVSALDALTVPTEPLASLTDSVFGVPRFKHIYSVDGIPYLDSEDIFKVNPEITKFIPKVTKKDADRYYVRAGWLLVASSGQLYGINGSVLVANAGHEGKLVSNHIVRIIPKGVRSGYLALALGHPVLGRPLLQRHTFGSSVPEIAPGDMASVAIPRLGAIENQIADRMEQASALRLQADREEDQVVEQVEEDFELALRR